MNTAKLFLRTITRPWNLLGAFATVYILIGFTGLPLQDLFLRSIFHPDLRYRDLSPEGALWQAEALAAARWHANLVIPLGLSVAIGYFQKEMTRERGWMLPGVRQEIVVVYVVFGVLTTLLLLQLLNISESSASLHLTTFCAAFLVFAVTAGNAKYPRSIALRVLTYLFMALVWLWPSRLRIVAEWNPILFCVACAILAGLYLRMELLSKTWQARTEQALRPKVDLASGDHVRHPWPGRVRLFSWWRARVAARESPLKRQYSLWPHGTKGSDVSSYLLAIRYERSAIASVDPLGIFGIVVLIAFLSVALVVLRLAVQLDIMGSLLLTILVAAIAPGAEPQLLRTLSRASRAKVFFWSSTRIGVVATLLNLIALAWARGSESIVALPSTSAGLNGNPLLLAACSIAAMPVLHWLTAISRRQWALNRLAGGRRIHPYWFGGPVWVLVVLTVNSVILLYRDVPTPGVIAGVLCAGALLHAALYVALERRIARVDLM